MRDAFVGIMIAFLLITIICLIGTVSREFTMKQFVDGELKVYKWSNVNDLNAELAKGYELWISYDITNSVLKKVSK